MLEDRGTLIDESSNTQSERCSTLTHIPPQDVSGHRQMLTERLHQEDAAR
jgi:hypothetical protein